MAPQLASQLRVLVCSPCGSSEEDDVSLQLGSAIGHLRGLPDSRCQVR